MQDCVSLRVTTRRKPLTLSRYAVLYGSSDAQEHPLYSEARPGKCEAYTWDATSGSEVPGVPFDAARLPPNIEPGSVDIVVLIFVFSALHPREWAAAAQNIYEMLKPRTGMVFLRDYGRHDMPQLRFRKNRLLSDNFYARGDGTRVYFFAPQELYEIFNAAPRVERADTAAGTLRPTDVAVTEAGSDVADRRAQAHRFDTLQLAVDRRLLVNRKERKRMYRVWLQAKLRKR